MAVTYLTNGQGAINEEDMPFKNDESAISIKEIQNKKVQTTVNSMIYFGATVGTTDDLSQESQALNETKTKMKEHISAYGSIYAGVYFPVGEEEYMNQTTGAVYVNDSKKVSNHAVSIIGWDDEYSKENFKIKPTIDGAWIVRNSWGLKKNEMTFAKLKEDNSVSEEKFEALLKRYEEQGYTIDRENQTIYKKQGDDGIYYVSYQDALIYSNMMGIVDADDEKTYDNLYQLDKLGGNYSVVLCNPKNPKSDVYLANKFIRNTEQKEYLTSVGITSMLSGATYEVYINPNGSDKSLSSLQKAELATGDSITLEAGYNTIALRKPFELNGKEFVIVLKQKNDGQDGSMISIESPAVDKNAFSYSDESFVTFDLNSNWTDLGAYATKDLRGNLCIKGITVNNYSGEVANPSQNPPQKEEPTGQNSNFNDAKVELNGISLNSDSKFKLQVKFSIKGIKVSNPCDKYVHYCYLSTSSNKSMENIEKEGRWVKVDESSFKKQADGTYNLDILLDKEEQFLGLDDANSSNLYIYVKEEAYTGAKILTKTYGPLSVSLPSENPQSPTTTQNPQSPTTTQKPQTSQTQDVDASKVKTITTQSSSIKQSNSNAPTRLPDTGIKTILVIGIVTLVASVVFFIKIKKMKDIK